MTVLAFSPSRLTPADLAAFRAIAEPNIERGLWHSIDRESSRDYDRLLIKLPVLHRVVFSFERDRAGLYHLYFHDEGGRYEIGTGRTAVDCLAIWRYRRQRDKAATVEDEMMAAD
jgi:hypothetical protein